MAAELASIGHSGLLVKLCGDVHLSNNGGFASPRGVHGLGRRDSPQRAMTRELLHGPGVGETSTLAVRWILPGAVPATTVDWFGRILQKSESRDDTYLLNPPEPTGWG
jgi:hypothetical protein